MSRRAFDDCPPTPEGHAKARIEARAARDALLLECLIAGVPGFLAIEAAASCSLDNDPHEGTQS